MEDNIVEDDEMALSVRRFVAESLLVPLESIRPETSLNVDLGIQGDDAYELFVAFHRRFDVDLRGFDFHRHFVGEREFVACVLPWLISLPLTPLLRMLGYKRRGRHRFVPVRISDLIRAARLKRWPRD